MATCEVCGRESTLHRDRTKRMCDRMAPDGDPIECVSWSHRNWMARAEKAEAELKRLTMWNPASTLPDTDRDVLVKCDDALTRVDFWSRLHQRWAAVGVSIDATVTHWRELPPGPEVTT